MQSCDQSTVSRNLKKSACVFGLSPVKVNGEWTFSGDKELLNMERKIHQEYRWTRGIPLRIDAQYYSGPLYLDPTPDGWIKGDCNFVDVKYPLSLIQSGVIDAWIACYPDVPSSDDSEFASVHLTRLPVRLVVSLGHPLLRLGSSITIDDVAQFPSLALPDGCFPEIQKTLQKIGLWNSPSQLSRYKYEEWEGRVEDELVVGYATDFSMGLFSNPQVELPIEIPLVVGDTLVLRKHFLEHRRTVDLLNHLRSRALELARLHQNVQVF